jgi:hypothetical protein
MARSGKPDATGRSSGKWSVKDQKIHGPPKGELWTWQTVELMQSPAWREMGINTRRLIDFLQIEHRNHAGRENGNLKATYDQLVDFGLTRSEIRGAIQEAKFLGLIKHTPGGRWAQTNTPSTFRLTFYADKDGAPPTNDWKPRTAKQIAAWKAEQAQLRKARKDRQRKQNRPLVRFAELR